MEYNQPVQTDHSLEHNPLRPKLSLSKLPTQSEWATDNGPFIAHKLLFLICCPGLPDEKWDYPGLGLLNL